MQSIQTDMACVASDWADRNHDVIEAYWCIRENMELFTWYRDTLLRNRVVGNGACRYFMDGKPLDDWDEIDAEWIEKEAARVGAVLPERKPKHEPADIDGLTDQSNVRTTESETATFGNRGNVLVER